VKPPGPAAELRRALARRKKAELVDVLMEMAEADRAVLRRLTTRFDVAATTDELVAATHQAIADATAFDKRDINRNFAYDHAAYAEVKRNLGRLIASGQLRLAMPLALELMKRGSHQVERDRPVNCIWMGVRPPAIISLPGPAAPSGRSRHASGPHPRPPLERPPQRFPPQRPDPGRIL
jgi:hypothetical protein